MSNTFLDKAVGEKKQIEHTSHILLFYLIILCGFVYLHAGSIEGLVTEAEIASSAWVNSEGDTESSYISSFSILSGFLIAYISQVKMYSQVKSIDITGILKIGVVTPFTYLFWFLFSFIGLFFIYLVINYLLIYFGVGISYSNILQGFGLLLATVASSIFAVVFCSLRGGWKFPSKFRKAVQNSHEELDEVEEHIENAKKEIDDHKFQESLASLKSANNSLQRAKTSQSSITGVTSRTKDCEKNIKETSELLGIKSHSYIETSINQMKDKEIQSAPQTTDESIEKNELSSKNIQKEKPTKRNDDYEAVQKVGNEIEKADWYLKQAEIKINKREFDSSREFIKIAEEIISEIKTFKGEEVTNEIAAPVYELEKIIEKEKEKEKVSEIRHYIAGQYDVDKSEIKTAYGTLRSYKKLNQLLDRIEKAESEKDNNLPWTQFRSGVISDLPGISIIDINAYEDIITDSIEIVQFINEINENYPSIDTEDWESGVEVALKSQRRNALAPILTEVKTCREIINDIKTIEEFLNSVNESHPSVYADEWRDAIETALAHQNREILNPATAQIERLQGANLWNKEDLHKMSWEEFENLIGTLYEKRGYKTNVTQKTDDMGVDVWAKKGGECVAIQVKQFSDQNAVGRETLQKLTSTIAKDDADKAIVITSGGFARTAEQYARDFGSKLEVIDGQKLIQMLSESDVPVPV